MSILETLKKPISLKNASENINPRYFQDNGDGTYTLTQTFIYNVMRDALAFYKEQVFKLDTECLYHTEKEAEFKDTWTEKLNNDQRQLKYGPQLAELEKRKRQWREDNPEKCSTRAGGPDLGDIDELRFFGGYSPEIKPTLQQAISLYKFLKEFSDGPAKDIKESLPQKPDVLLVKEEFAKEYKALQDKWSEELGIPVVTEQVGTVTRTKFTINQLRNKNMKAVSSSDDGLTEYVKGLIKYITSSNKVEYKKAREEMITLIDRDFVEILGSSKTISAQTTEVKDSSGSISEIQRVDIYTRPQNSDIPRSKIISISRDDPKDDYRFICSITTETDNLTFSRKITTKAELRKAIETTINMIEMVDEFKVYKSDLENLADSI